MDVNEGVFGIWTEVRVWGSTGRLTANLDGYPPPFRKLELYIYLAHTPEGNLRIPESVLGLVNRRCLMEDKKDLSIQVRKPPIFWRLALEPFPAWLIAGYSRKFGRWGKHVYQLLPLKIGWKQTVAIIPLAVSRHRAISEESVNV